MHGRCRCAAATAAAASRPLRALQFANKCGPVDRARAPISCPSLARFTCDCQGEAAAPPLHQLSLSPKMLFLVVLGGAAVLEVHRAKHGGSQELRALREKEAALRRQLQVSLQQLSSRCGARACLLQAPQPSAGRQPAPASRAWLHRSGGRFG